MPRRNCQTTKLAQARAEIARLRKVAGAKADRSQTQPQEAGGD